MENRLADEDLKHTINKALLDQAEKIREEKKLLQARLEKLQSSKSSVSESVYRRVRSDYLAKLDQVEQGFSAIRTDLNNELVAIAEKKSIIEENLKYHKESVEECELRHSLSEISEEEFKKTKEEETKEVARLEKGLQLLSADLSRLEETLKEAEVIKEKIKPHTSPSITEEQPAHKPPPPIETTGKVEMGSKKTTKVPQLILMESGKEIQKYPIDRNLQIGRSPSSDVVLNEPKVSRKHAQIQIAGEKCVLIDMESSNGTYVGAKKISEHILKSGDEIRIGKSQFVFKT